MDSGLQYHRVLYGIIGGILHTRENNQHSVLDALYNPVNTVRSEQKKSVRIPALHSTVRSSLHRVMRLGAINGFHGDLDMSRCTREDDAGRLELGILQVPRIRSSGLILCARGLNNWAPKRES
jgi:hypothetical protein